jgi:spermidine synthase
VRQRAGRAAFFAFFLLSGAGLLLAEIAWFHANKVAFGIVPSSWGGVLASLFLGQALGCLAARRIPPTLPASLVLGVALALAFPLSFALPRLLDPSVVPWVAAAGSALPWLLSAAAILPAAAALGAAMTLLSRASTPRLFVAGYGAQAVGALVGLWLGGFLLPWRLGYGSVALAASLVLAASALCLVPGGSPAAGEPSPRGDAAVAAPGPLAFGSGFLALLLETALIRAVSLTTDNSINAFGAVSLAVILLCALGALAAAHRLMPGPSPRLLAAVSLLSGGGVAAAGAILFLRSGGLSLRLFSAASGLAASLGEAAWLVLPAFGGQALLFPLILRLGSGEGGRTGTILFLNGLGCFAGALAGGEWILPRLGIWAALFAVTAGYGLLTALLGRGILRAAGCGTALAAVAGLVTSPLPLVTPADPHGGEAGRVVSMRQGRHGLVSVIDFPGGERTLWLNNSYLLEAGAGSGPITRRMGLLPATLHPSARRAAVIGLGTGITASGLLPGDLEEMTLIELIPEVAAAAAEDFAAHNAGVVRDPRVRLVTDDGRNFMRRHRGTFDLVVTDIVTPWNEGSAWLYTADHFREVERRLAPGGIFCLWLPLYQLTAGEFGIIAATLGDVFPRITLWQLGSSVRAPVVGLVASREPLDRPAIRQGIARPVPEGFEDLVRVHEAGLFSRSLGPLPASVPGTARNTLDRPLLEFLAAGPGRTLLTGDAFLAFAAPLARRRGDGEGGHLRGWGPEIDNWREAGWDLTLANALLERGDRAGAAALLERVGALLPVEEMR